MTDWLQVIRDLGFPIAVAIYLIVVQQKRLHQLTEEITKLRIAIIFLAHRIGVDASDGGRDNVNLLD